MELEHLKVGQTVRAFHPRRFGVVDTGTVVTVGRKWVHVDFGSMLGGTFRVAPDHVIEVVEPTAPWWTQTSAPYDHGYDDQAAQDV